MAIWEKLFSKITFKNYPDTSTPLNASNMNALSDAIDGIDDRVVELNSNLEQTNSKFTLIGYTITNNPNVVDKIYVHRHRVHRDNKTISFNVGLHVLGTFNANEKILVGNVQADARVEDITIFPVAISDANATQYYGTGRIQLETNGDIFLITNIVLSPDYYIGGSCVYTSS